MGDAAHASTPHQVAGAGMAIEDAYVLSNLLGMLNGPDGIEGAFKAYDSVRRPRTQRFVATSREHAHLVALELEGYEDNFEKIGENLSRRMDWIWNEDLPGEVEAGRKMMIAEGVFALN